MYNHLGTKEGQNGIYRLTKVRERRRRDLGFVMCIKDVNGYVLVKDKDIRNRWHNYFKELFNEKRIGVRAIGADSASDFDFGVQPSMSRAEVNGALPKIGRGKATGPNQIPIEPHSLSSGICGGIVSGEVRANLSSIIGGNFNNGINGGSIGGILVKNHPLEHVIGGITYGLKTRKGNAFFCAYAAFLAQKEPKNVKEALEDENLILAMQEELNQFEQCDVWELVKPLKNTSVIGTKWIFKNKEDEFGIVTRNKARLVTQGYNQQEGIDFDQTYAPIDRLESIRMLLAYACYKKIKLHQMDVKTAFLIGFMEEEVYVKQPPGFEHEQHPDYVYKLKKALYGLTQAPRAWQNGNDILIIEMYADDIIFGSTNDSMWEWFSKCMSSEFDMSMIDELNSFLGLQIKQSKDGIYVH
ncbi:hypothetical protein AgCh_022974 [Apium graveolens]